MSSDETSRLLVAALGGGLEHETLTRLWGLTNGNVLYLREIVHSALAEAQLVRHETGWRLGRDFAPSSRLRELVHRRIGELSAPALDAIRLLAYGEPLGTALMARLVHTAVLDDLETRELVSVQRDGRRIEARLAHPLYGEVVRSDTSVGEQRSLVLRLARAVETDGTRRKQDVLRVATWRLEAGAPDHPDCLLAAAEEAFARFDHRLGARLAEAALDAGGGAGVRLALAEARHGQLRHAEAAELLAPLEDLPVAPEVPDPAAGDVLSYAQRAKVAVLLVRVRLWGLGDPGSAMDALVRASGSVGTGQPAEDLVAARVHLLAALGQVGEALRVADTAAATAQGGEGGEGSVTNVARASAQPLALAGRFRDAESLIDRWSISAASDADSHPGTTIEPFLAQFLTLLLAGKLSEAEALAERVHDGSLLTDSPVLRAPSALALGRTRLLQGAPLSAVRLFEEAIGWLREDDVDALLPWALSQLGAAYALLGRVAEAQDAMRATDAARRPSDRMFQADIAAAHAWVLAAAGDSRQAQAILRAAAQAAAELGQHPLAALAWHDTIRLGAGAGALARVEAEADACEGTLMGCLKLHAAATRRGQGHALEAAAEAFESIGALIHAAETQAQASIAYQQAGLRVRSRASATRSAVLRERCEGAHTPVLDAADDPVTLTRRERDIASLAGQGLSNQAIAAQLVVSVRTVEGHLYQAFAKLGVGSRSELPGFLAVGAVDLATNKQTTAAV